MHLTHTYSHSRTRYSSAPKGRHGRALSSHIGRAWHSFTKQHPTFHRRCGRWKGTPVKQNTGAAGGGGGGGKEGRGRGRRRGLVGRWVICASKKKTDHVKNKVFLVYIRILACLLLMSYLLSKVHTKLVAHRSQRLGSNHQKNVIIALLA